MSREREIQETPKPLVMALVAFTAVMLILAIILGYKWEKAPSTESRELLLLCAWAALNCIVGGFAALWAWAYRAPQDAATSTVSPMKMLVFAVGGTLGFTTFI